MLGVNIPRPRGDLETFLRDVVRILDTLFARVQSRLEDVVIQDNRLILRDSSGNYWSVTVDTNGNLSTEDLGTEL